MRDEQVDHGVRTARSVAAALGVLVDDAQILHRSNRLAVRLLPGDVLVRVAPATAGTRTTFARELDLTHRLVGLGSPVARPHPLIEPTVREASGFVLSFWSFLNATTPVSAGVYAETLWTLHDGLRRIDVALPNFRDRVAEAQALVSDVDRTPDLGARDRLLLQRCLDGQVAAIDRRGAEEQPLHGEPHPGNLLGVGGGAVVIDLETCCRGPIEFDIAHAPAAVAAAYPAADPGLVAACRVLVDAMVAAWRWDRDDRLPDGRTMGLDLLARLREGQGG